MKNYARAAHFSIAHLEPNQVPNMELFQKSVYGFKPFLISTKSFILDVSLSSEYASVSRRGVNVSSYKEIKKSA